MVNVKSNSKEVDVEAHASSYIASCQMLNWDLNQESINITFNEA